ncbi:MAG: hypothetical protein PF503_18690 [Desulfobacula sp.]|jgi:hypothetical protein|nr:hypothetical protein [Desulfobacula sp.]
MTRKLSNQLLILFALVLLAFMSQGCFETGPTPYQQMTTIHDLYNAQYADYMVTTGYVNEDGFWVKKTSPELTENKKKILREKKKVLSDVYPLIEMYDNLVITGGTVPPDLMPRILAMLESFL